MRYPKILRAVALLVLPAAFLAGTAQAQTTSGAPQPAVMTDTAPLPAGDRMSTGAVILMDEPVIAQRRQMEQLAAREVDTRTLGAGPARALTPQELEAFQRGMGAPACPCLQK